MAFLPAVFLLLAIPVCLFFQAVAGWAQSDSCGGNEPGCFPPGIIVLAPMVCLIAATFAAFLAPLPPKTSKAGGVLAGAGLGLFLVAAVTFGIDLNWGSA